MNVLRPFVDSDEPQEETEDPDDPDDPDDPEPTVEEEEVNKSPKKQNEKSKQRTRWNILKQMPFVLNCEWAGCDYSNVEIEEFVTHVGNHIPELAINLVPVDSNLEEDESGKTRNL